MNRDPAFRGQARLKNPKAELMRLRASYRGAALRGELSITGEGGLRAMRMLVGPDCAYHLYRGVPVRNRE